MNLLSSIVDDVIQIAEAISLALNCDVEVADTNLTRIAGTGSLKSIVGEKLRHGHIYSYLMHNKQNIILDNPGFHFLCSSCKIKGTCYCKSTISSPIMMDDTVLGVISIISLNDETTAYIKKNANELSMFVRRMAELVASKASEKSLLKNLQIATAVMDGIIDNDNRGIVAMNHEGRVLRYNKTVLSLFNIKDDAEAKQALERTFSAEIIEQTYSTKQKIIGNKCILVHIKPIYLSGNNTKEILWLFTCQDFAKIKKSASSLTVADNNITFNDIYTRSKKMISIIQMTQKIAHNDSTVLILGESGTGKEMFARAIHSQSGRTGPLIPINCGAIPEPLLESELFGYEPGAFTGANKEGKPGKFELADGGTLFLDEIGMMPLHLQCKLLRVLEDRKVDRLGGSITFPLNVRIIAATNEDLQKKVKEGRFRGDLFFRINVIPIYLPPLRERKEDILPLADHFLQVYSDKFAKNITAIDPSACGQLESYDWPGNIRELSNAIEFAVNMEETSSIKPESLPFLSKISHIKENPALGQLKSDILKQTLDEFGYGKKGKMKAAEILGVSLATIYRWVDKYQL